MRWERVSRRVDAVMVVVVVVVDGDGVGMMVGLGG